MLFADDALLITIVTAASSLLGTIFTGVVALGVAWLAVLQSRAAVQAAQVAGKLDAHTIKTEAALATVAEKVEEVHKATNSLTDRLVETTRIEAHAAGVKQGEEGREGGGRAAGTLSRP